MRSFTHITSIPNNATATVGPARFGVRWVDGGPPVRAEIIVMPFRETGSLSYEVALGETFPVGEETWRFADLDMKNADQWEVTVRRVDENEELTPPTGRVWKSARLRPYGQLDEAQIVAVEQELGLRLPPEYRDWLRRTNGAQPEVEHHVPGLPFMLMPERPLLGVHPQYPHVDLVHAQRVHRDAWLSPAWLVVANPSGGLLVVAAREPHDEGVHFLPESGMRGAFGAGGAADRERYLRPVARSFGYFLGRLTPFDAGGLPPAQLLLPGDPGHSRHEDQP